MATAPPTPYASASLYVGDLATDVTEALLFEIFNAVGPVASVRVCRDAATRRSLGYAYVNFHRLEDAERALDTMNFKAIRGKPCRIMWSHRDPSLRKSGRGNIFVKNLAPTIDNKSLYDTFSMFGNILSCKVSTDGKGESLGYGFVHYEGEESATTAIERVNGKVIAGEMVVVSAFKSRQERGVNVKTDFTNLYVKNLPESYDDEKVNELFAKYGEIQSCKVSKDEKGVSKGFGFVNFTEADNAKAAVEALNGFEIAPEKRLFVDRAQKKEEREKELREHFEQLKVERQKKYAGVNLYIKNLADTTDDNKLLQEFSEFGSITSARVMMDNNGKSKGFGFVCFSTPEEATKAVNEMNGRMLDNKPLYVSLAQRKDQRRAQLDQQYAGRMKGGAMGQPQMFPGPGGVPQPLFYPGVPQRNFVYPTQQMMRQWQQPGQQQGPLGAPQMGVNYQLMAVSQRGGGRGRASRNVRKGSENVRNRDQSQRMSQQQQQRMPQQQMPEQQPQQPQQPPAATAPTEPQRLTITELAAAPEEQRKQMIGERLFPLVKALNPVYAGKITGMLLEMDNGELLHLLESPSALTEKVNEAQAVLEEFQANNPQ